MADTLLTPDEKQEIIGYYKEIKAGYQQISALIAESKPTGEVKVKLEKIDESLMEFHKRHEEGLKRVESVELKIAERAAGVQSAKSIGRRVTESPEFAKAMKDGGRLQFTVKMNDAQIEWKDMTGLGLLQPVPLPGTVPTGPELIYGVRSLIPQGRTSGGAVEYLRETGFTNNAAPVAEGAAKPKSDLTFAIASAPVQTIAHYFKITRQSFDDVPALEAIINTRGIYGVKIKEDNQLLNGTGVSPQLQGIMPLAAAAPAASAGTNLIDRIGLAVFDLAAKGFLPDGAVVNPADWGLVALQKNTQGNYLFANPLEYTANNRLWGVRMVQSANMTATNFLVGAFQGHALLLDRAEVSVQVATQNEDDFIKNLYTILIEERLVNLVFTPAAFEKGVVALAAGALTLGGGEGEGEPAQLPEGQRGQGIRTPEAERERRR